MDPNKFFAERFTRSRVKYWEIIADNLSEARLEFGLDCSLVSRRSPAEQPEELKRRYQREPT
jgi:hypothetical protein